MQIPISLQGVYQPFFAVFENFQFSIWTEIVIVTYSFTSRGCGTDNSNVIITSGYLTEARQYIKGASYLQVWNFKFENSWSFHSNNSWFILKFIWLFGFCTAGQYVLFFTWIQCFISVSLVFKVLQKQEIYFVKLYHFLHLHKW